MVTISPEDIKKLREMTSCGVIDCKKALEEAGGNFDKAKEALRKRGLELAAKKGGRETKEGRVECYIHPGNKIAVLLEVNCETDFVARNEDFIKTCKDIAMHIAALNPKYVRREDVPEDVLKKESDPNAFYKEKVLLDQAFVKDSSKSINDLITGLIGSIGENISVGRFVRYKINDLE